MEKKGSIKIFETIMVVFIFVVIILVGLIFFEKYTLAGIQQDADDFLVLRLHALRATMPESAELVCTEFGYKGSCIDSYRAVVFNGLSNAGFTDIFRERYGYKNITLRAVYPSNKVSTSKCDVSNLVSCGIWEIYSFIPSEYSSKIVVETPVSIYYPNSDDFAIGVLRIEEYGK